MEETIEDKNECCDNICSSFEEEEIIVPEKVSESSPEFLIINPDQLLQQIFGMKLTEQLKSPVGPENTIERLGKLMEQLEKEVKELDESGEDLSEDSSDNSSDEDNDLEQIEEQIIPSVVPEISTEISTKSLERSKDDIISCSLPLYIIHSSYNLDTIKDIIEEVLGEKISGCVILRDRNSYDTGMSLVLLTNEQYKIMEEKGYSEKQTGYDFRIRPFILRSGNCPPQGFNHNFFIPYPRIENIKPYLLISQMNNELKTLSSYGLIKQGSWRIISPSRDKPYFYVIFRKDIDLVNLAACRLYLYNSTWTGSLERILCRWSRLPKNKTKQV